jgi:hypothetical protein
MNKEKITKKYGMLINVVVSLIIASILILFNHNESTVTIITIMTFFYSQTSDKLKALQKYTYNNEVLGYSSKRSSKTIGED